MNLSTEESTERRNLVGFCERCDEWYSVVDDPDNPDSRQHNCGNMPSHKVGFQLTTRRTFNTTAKKMTKAQLKKMSSVGA